MSIIIDNKRFRVDIEGECSKREFNSLKRQLNILLGYLTEGNKKTYIIAKIDREDHTVDINISTYLFNEENDIIITMDISNRLPMYIKSINHTFSSFSTEFLKTTNSTTLEIIDKECWSPVITLGNMYIYFVNFFREYNERPVEYLII